MLNKPKPHRRGLFKAVGLAALLSAAASQVAVWRTGSNLERTINAAHAERALKTQKLATEEILRKRNGELLQSLRARGIANAGYFTNANFTERQMENLLALNNRQIEWLGTIARADRKMALPERLLVLGEIAGMSEEQASKEGAKRSRMFDIESRVLFALAYAIPGETRKTPESLRAAAEHLVELRKLASKETNEMILLELRSEDGLPVYTTAKAEELIRRAISKAVQARFWGGTNAAGLQRRIRQQLEESAPAERDRLLNFLHSLSNGGKKT
ncbi:MAG TPA: hypothetical protein VJH23_04765 [archaeon]|nr:hypothetical protein [archaeon]